MNPDCSVCVESYFIMCCFHMILILGDIGAVHMVEIQIELLVGSCCLLDYLWFVGCAITPPLLPDRELIFWCNFCRVIFCSAVNVDMGQDTVNFCRGELRWGKWP